MQITSDAKLQIREGVYQPANGSSIDELATPALLVDLDGLNANINRMMALFPEGKVAVRPHMKTAKTHRIANLLHQAGAAGICVTKVSEAAVMVAGGISDILITSPVGHPVTAWWLANMLQGGASIKVVIDSKEGADILSTALADASIGRMEVLIDLNVGQNRTGVSPGIPAVDLAHYISTKDNLSIIGCQGYEGHLQMMTDMEEKERLSKNAMNSLVSTAKMLREAGHQIRIVTTGGTGSCLLCASVEGITEVQPGSFIFMDTTYVNAIGSDNFSHALFVLSTVISKPSPEKATVDAGWKSLSIDSGPARPFNSAWSYRSAGDEHGYISGEGVDSLNIGDRVLLLPSHIDTTVALHEVYYIMQNGKLVDIWPIEARGRVQ
jgi:D-serine deaminase-like pyridoxal phosphate-dependent protein